MSPLLEVYKMTHNEHFYKWEKEKYGDDSPLSDADRELWIEGCKEGMLALFEGFIERVTNDTK